MRLNRLLATVAVLAMAVPWAAQAQTPTPARPGQPVEVEIDQGVLRPLQIAIAPFAGQNGAELAGVVRGDLRRSGYFEPLDPASFVETGLTLANAPNFPQWTAIGAQAVLYGSVTPRPDGRNDVGFRLYDPYRQCQLVSYQFTATPEQWRRIAHKIADVVYQRMTGESGFFDSRVIFVAESGTQLNKLSRLTISDQDGYNPVFLTQGDEVIMSPRFSTSDPDEITYVALGRDYSRIYIYNLSTGRRESLGEFDGQVLAPRFSNDGTRIAFSIIKGGNTDVWVINLRTRQLSRLTSDPGIDTSPSFSPDGSQIVFNSDRTGTPRLYVMRSDGSGGRLLSSSYFQEGPSWAPNGRYVMFARSAPGGDARLWTVDLSGRVVSQAGYAGRGSDPAWSPLLDGPPSNIGFNQSPDSCPN